MDAEQYLRDLVAKHSAALESIPEDAATQRAGSYASQTQAAADALVATGQVAQITYHLNRAMDNGLTKEEAGEVVGHLAFYAGWPNAFSAAPVLKEVIEKRPR